MQNFSLLRKRFDLEEQSSEESTDSVIYISSDSEEEVSDSWDSDWSTDTEMLIDRIERKVKSSPMLIGGSIMTTEGVDGELEAGPCSSQSVPPTSPKLSLQYFDKEMCHAPSRWTGKTRIELCKTLLRVMESPMSPEHEKGPSLDTYNLWTITTTLPTIFRMYSLMRISAIRNASAAWCAAICC